MVELREKLDFEESNSFVFFSFLLLRRGSRSSKIYRARRLRSRFEKWRRARRVGRSSRRQKLLKCVARVLEAASAFY